MVKVVVVPLLVLAACSSDPPQPVCTPLEPGDQLTVQITSPVKFDELVIMQAPYPTETINVAATTSYEYHYSSGFHPNAPRMLTVEASFAGVPVAHGSASQIQYGFDGCNYVAALTLPLVVN